MTDIITTDTIINWIKDKVESKEPVSPGVFVDAAQKLNVLLSDEHAELIKWQNAVAVQKAGLINGGYSVAKAKAVVEATEEYKQMLLQKAKIDRIVEFIRISKLQARMKMDEMRSY